MKTKRGLACLLLTALAVLAAVFTQLGDTLETLAAQAALLEAGRRGGESSCGL